MRNREEPDLETLVKASSLIPEGQLTRFIDLLPKKFREQLLQRLGKETVPAATTETEDVDETRVLPPTVIVEPGQEPTCEEQVVSPSTNSLGSGNVSLVKLHARGAVGEVFVAFDKQLSRELALKRIRPDLPRNERRFQRFVREAEFTAKLQHPGIVPIYDFHLKGDETHYTMPLVSGSNLSTLISQTHKEIGSRTRSDVWMTNMRPLLNHFIGVCNAIDYAHSQGVLHRDIKPENIMIGTQGQTLVLDWGCAKSIDDGNESGGSALQIEDEELANILGVEPQQGMTIAGSVMGTIGFMSPEQASGKSNRIGPPSDIFGLGATLFNLLTNELAFTFQQTDRDSVYRALEEIQQGSLRRVDKIDHRVPKAIAAVCHQAMAFKPEDRYVTAGDLARDIDAFLAGEPVTALEERFSDRCVRYVRRHQTAFTTLLGTLLVGFFSLALLAFMGNSQRAKLSEKNLALADLNSRLQESVATERLLTLAATIREREGEQQLYETEMLLASEASSEPGGFGRMRQLVRRWSQPDAASFRGWEWDHLSEIGNQEFWTVDLGSTLNRIIYTRDNPLARAFDFTKSKMFTIDTNTKRIVDERSLPRGATCADLIRDQSLLAIGFQDGSVSVLDLNDKTAKPVKFSVLKSAVNDVCWNIGGDYLAACDAAGALVVWQWHEQRVSAKFAVNSVLKQGGKRLLNWSYDGKELVWTTGRQIRGLTMETDEERLVAEDIWIMNPTWSHEGKLLAWIGGDDVIVVWDPDSGNRTRFPGHQLFVETLNWHPSQHFLMSSSGDGSLRIWDVDKEKAIRQFLGHGGHVYAASWNSDGTQVVSGGLPEDQFHVWDVSNVGSLGLDRELQAHPAFAWHPDGVQLAVTEGASILIQDSSGNSRLLEDSDTDGTKIFGIAYAPDGKRLACVSASGRIWTVDTNSGALLKVYDSGSEVISYPDLTAKSVAWSPDGTWLAGIGSGKKVKIWDEESGKEVAQKIRGKFGKSLVIAWAPKINGAAKLAVAGTNDQLLVIDPSKRQIVNQTVHGGWTTGLAWSPDGTQLAVSDKRSIRIWDPETSTEVGFCEGPSAMIRDLSWSSSEGRIAAIAEDGLVCLWNDKTLAYCAKFKLHQRSPYAIRWSPDGSQLVSTARHGHIVFQDAEGREAVEAAEPTQKQN